MPGPAADGDAAVQPYVGHAVPAAERPEVTEAPTAEQRRLQAFVETPHAEGAIERLEACGHWDACLSITAMFRSFSEADKMAIARLIRRYFETLPIGGGPVLSVRFLDARTGRELGRVHDDRLFWQPDLLATAVKTSRATG